MKEIENLAGSVEAAELCEVWRAGMGQIMGWCLQLLGLSKASDQNPSGTRPLKNKTTGFLAPRVSTDRFEEEGGSVGLK